VAVEPERDRDVSVPEPFLDDVRRNAPRQGESR
jgi:hypothetical protein